ncbi:MAG TPA: hypothetical protein VLG38_03060 [Gammaproteobacteria bacterium]|nr:hypothetical protein [Gammaproteobacteria bacterium]
MLANQTNVEPTTMRRKMAKISDKVLTVLALLFYGAIIRAFLSGKSDEKHESLEIIDFKLRSVELNDNVQCNLYFPARVNPSSIQDLPINRICNVFTFTPMHPNTTQPAGNSLTWCFQTCNPKMQQYEMFRTIQEIVKENPMRGCQIMSASPTEVNARVAFAAKKDRNEVDKLLTTDRLVGSFFKCVNN